MKSKATYDMRDLGPLPPVRSDVRYKNSEDDAEAVDFNRPEVLELAGMYSKAGEPIDFRRDDVFDVAFICSGAGEPIRVEST